VKIHLSKLKEIMMSEAVKDLIQQAMDQDFNNANKTFQDVMTIKLSDLLDQEKVRIADQIYNGVDPEEEELDLEDDIDAEEDEGVQESDPDAEESMGDEGSDGSEDEEDDDGEDSEES